MRHAFVLIPALVSLAACGDSPPSGGDAAPDAGGAPASPLAVVPAEATTRASGTPLRFAATLDGAEAAVDWHLEGPGAV